MIDNSAALAFENDRQLPDSGIVTTPVSRLDKAIERARAVLVKLQHDDGFWVFELEADCTITSEYIFLMHYIGTSILNCKKKFANICVPGKAPMGATRCLQAGMVTSAVLQKCTLL